MTNLTNIGNNVCLNVMEIRRSITYRLNEKQDPIVYTVRNFCCEITTKVEIFIH